MTSQLESSRARYRSRLAELAELALRGLRDTYGRDATLPYTMRWDGATAYPEGHSIRYALITLLGLEQGRAVAGPTDDLAETLWHRINDRGSFEGLTAGDYGLGLWASSLWARPIRRFTARRALAELLADPKRCDSVDLSWLLLGAEQAIARGRDDADAPALVEEAKGHLLALYNASTCLFYRHPRSGAASSVSRRVACFANQVYPLMALSVHAKRTACDTSLNVVASLGNNLCRMQGPLGQWWWLYDAKDGGVVDGYPVFSVHQDGMALMALFWARDALGVGFDDAINRSLNWLDGANERHAPMVTDGPGLILRDIHRYGVGRVGRMFGGMLHCLGRTIAWNGGKETAAFRVNAECRPYHLGWVLYAAGLAHQAAPKVYDAPPATASASLQR